MKHATIGLGYWKQGDDFAHHLEKFPSSSMNAIASMKGQMENVAEQLDQIAQCLSEFSCEGIEMRGDTHSIWISGPDEVIDALVQKELATIDDWGDEEENDDELEEDEDESSSFETDDDTKEP